MSCITYYIKATKKTVEIDTRSKEIAAGALAISPLFRPGAGVGVLVGVVVVVATQAFL